MRILSIEDLRALKGINYHPSSLWRKSKAGSFPKPIKLGANKVGWIEGEIDAWLEARVQERDLGGGVNGND